MITEQTVCEAFRWPLARELPGCSFGLVLYRRDTLIERLGALISQRRAWTPISGATKRTLSAESLSSEIAAQNAHLRRLLSSGILTGLRQLDISEFPSNPQGASDSRIIATSSTIAFLIDDTKDFLQCLTAASPRRTDHSICDILEQDIGTFLYVSNSVDAGGRAFKGDPFTGQAAAYSRIFAWNMKGEKERNFVAYYPNQLISQFLTASGSPPRAKGVKMLRQEASLIVAHDGACLDPKPWRVAGQ